MKLPHEAIRSKLSGQNIVEVVEEDLCYFQNLTYLDLSDNRVKIEQLSNLTNLAELNLQFNSLASLLINEDMFPQLEKLHLSFNHIPVSHIANLRHLRCLQVLDLASNDLVTLPEDLSFLMSVEELNLSSNQFNSESTLVQPEKLFFSIGQMPKLKRLNVARNKFVKFHFEELKPGSFGALQEIEFSYNLVED